MALKGDENMENLIGEEQDFSCYDLMDFIEAGKDDPVPMTMNCVSALYDDKKVVVQPASLNTLDMVPDESGMFTATLILLEAA